MFSRDVFWLLYFETHPHAGKIIAATARHEISHRRISAQIDIGKLHTWRGAVLSRASDAASWDLSKRSKPPIHLLRLKDEYWLMRNYPVGLLCSNDILLGGSDE